MNLEDHKTTIQKALEINLDTLFYGSIAEIGAGQEVARSFFQVGGASGTVAKTISAYDMQISNDAYGRETSGRYVTQERVQSMLDKEFAQAIRRLSDVRPKDSRFFAFADTISAKAYNSNKPSHGWMGIQFQRVSMEYPSQIVLHVNLRDKSNHEQQQAIGVLGVNLIYSVFNYAEDSNKLLDSLTENLEWGRVEPDFIEFSGPAFDKIDNKNMMLRLVQSGLTPVVMYNSDGESVTPKEFLYKKDILILRGNFKPFSNVHQDMMRFGSQKFLSIHKTKKEKSALFCEINIAQYVADGEGDISDLIPRVNILTQLGYNVMITSHFRYFRISEYLLKETQSNIGFIISTENIHQIFNNDYYEGYEGGLLSALGKLFAHGIKLFVYPNITSEGELITLNDIQIEHNQRHLFQHLLNNKFFIPIEYSKNVINPISDHDISELIKKGNPKWEELIPETAVSYIKKEKLFNYKVNKK